MANSAAPGGQETQTLEAGRSIEREIFSGQSHSYRITLGAGMCLRVHVEQQGIDVTVALLTPDGKVIAESKSDNGNFGPEIVSMIAEEPVEIRLEVRGPGWGAPPGRYEAKIADLRPVTAQDRKRVEAERAFAQGERLSEQGTAEAKNQAITKYESALDLYRSINDRNSEAASLNKIGEVYHSTFEKQKSLDAFNQALGLYRSLGDRGGEALALNNIGRVYYRIGERQKALDYFDRALQLSRDAGNRQAEWMVLTFLGHVYRARGDKQRALSYYDEALQLIRIIGPLGREGSALNNIALVYDSIEEKQKALEYYNRALIIRREVGDRGGEASTLNNIGLVYFSLGEKHEALDYFKRALPLRRAMGDREGEAITLHNIGSAYNDIGEKQQALDHFQQALLIRRDVGDRGGEAVTLNNLGRLYKLLGEEQKALEYYNQALTIGREIDDRGGEASALNNIGSLYNALGEYKTALENFSQSLAIWRKVKDLRGEGVTLNNIGLAYEQSGDNQRALGYFDQSLSLRRAVNDLEGQAATFYNIGMTRLSLGEREAALESFTEALRLSRAVSDPAVEARALRGIAQAERDRGNLTEARAKIEAALKIVESLRTKIDEGELRASYLGATQTYYEFCIDLFMRLHRLDPSKNYAAAAFQTSERARARALIETLAEARADIRNGIDPGLLARERALRQRLESKTDLLIRLLRDKRAEEQVVTAKNEVEELEIEFEQIQSQIRAASPRYAALSQPQPLSLAEIQEQALDDDTLLLEYSLGTDRSYLWAVTKTSITGYVLPPRKEIEQSANHVRDLLMARTRIVKFEAPDERLSRIAQADAEYPKAAATLSRMLLGPVAGQLEKKRLLVVGDGALQYVPFAALPTLEAVEQRDRGTVGQKGRENLRPNSSQSLRPSVPLSHRPYAPLIVDHEIVSLPSASTLAVLRRELAGRKPGPKTVAVLADPVFELNDERLKTSSSWRPTKPAVVAETRAAEPMLESDLTRSERDLGLVGEGFRLPRLPFTRKEAQTILSLVPADQRLVALDFAANQTAATSNVLARYRYVHFATHGLLNPRRPELSGIVLSLFNEQGAEEDGFLTAREVLNLNLPAELVVLSGCRTGLGKDVRGEGLVGLTRGFMYAGAARVLVSLWDVNDQATSELMGRLYRGMLGKRRLSPAAALREAQIALWSEKRWREPYYWAGFTLQGEPR